MPGSELDVAALADAIAGTAARIDVDDLAVIVATATPRRLATDERLVAEGAPGAELYVVVAGELAVEIENQVVLGRCGPGSILGEVSFLDRMRATATVTATEPSEVLVLDRGAFDTLAAEHPEATTALLRLLCATLARRVRTSSDLFETLVLEVPAAATPRRGSFVAVLRSLFVRSSEEVAS